MSIWIIDVLCAVLVVLGVLIAFRRPPRPPVRLGQTRPDANDQPQTYIMRIGGVMLATFGLALGLMATVCHFA